jgi:hypothetical protein
MCLALVDIVFNCVSLHNVVVVTFIIMEMIVSEFNIQSSVFSTVAYTGLLFCVQPLR